MTPDPPTDSISLHYLVEFSDDAEHPEPAETEVILLPPPSAPDGAAKQVKAPGQEPETK